MYVSDNDSVCTKYNRANKPDEFRQSLLLPDGLKVPLSHTHCSLVVSHRDRTLHVLFSPGVQARGGRKASPIAQHAEVEVG